MFRPDALPSEILAKDIKFAAKLETAVRKFRKKLQDRRNKR
jgi:hypothetical protein